MLHCCGLLPLSTWLVAAVLPAVAHPSTWPSTGAGPQLDLPHDVTPAQLETLLNGLLQNSDPLPYSFFLEDQEVAGELGAHLLRNQVRIFRVVLEGRQVCACPAVQAVKRLAVAGLTCMAAEGDTSGSHGSSAPV